MLAADSGSVWTPIVLALIGAGGTVVSALLLRGQNRIHTLVNSNLDDVKHQVLELEKEILLLRQQVIDGGGSRSDLPPTIMNSELPSEMLSAPPTVPSDP